MARDRFFNASTKAEWDTSLTNALIAFGIPEPFTEEIPEKGHLRTKVQQTLTDEEGNEYTTTKDLNLDWWVTFPKSKDENGDFIVTETDDDGNPTAYQIEAGYSTNIGCNQDLVFEGIVEKFPEQPQSKLA